MPTFHRDSVEGRTRPVRGAAPEQLTLGFDAPRRGAHPRITENLFFAILPDDAAKARIGKLTDSVRKATGIAGNRVEPGCLHLSLQSLGAHARPRPDIVALGKRIGSAIDVAPFDVSFDRLLSFNARNGHALVLGSNAAMPELNVLLDALGDGMSMAGLGHYVRRQFAPHVTLFYCGRRIDPIAIEPISWSVRALVLVRSLYGQGRHVHLGRWPLRD